MEQGDDLIFGMDDVEGALPAINSRTSLAAVSSNGVASDRAAASPVSLLSLQKPVAHLAAWRANLSRPGAAPTSRPIAIHSRSAAPQTALQQHMPAHQQLLQAKVQLQQTQHVQQRSQLTVQRLQLSTFKVQEQQQTSQPQPQRINPQASNAESSQAAVSSSGVCPPTSRPSVSNLSPQLPAKSAKLPSDIRSTRSTRSSDSEGSIMTAVSSAMAPEDAAMLEAAGLPPIRRVIMRGSSGKFKSQARMYQPELPPKYYCASQAA